MKSTEGMRVIGIDPAPAKGLSVFDGRDSHAQVGEARAFMQKIAVQSGVLICWDAPLTGPAEAALDGPARRGDYTKRQIERFFSASDTGFVVPDGISVQGYSGCQHWTISRALVGLPRTGPFDAGWDRLPFALWTNPEPPSAQQGRYIVEVHPAVALWLWCREHRPDSVSWNYKKSPLLLAELWAILKTRYDTKKVLDEFSHLDPPASDDELDARVAYLLGRLWLSSPAAICLLGNRNTGSFLLPRTDGLERAFASFAGTE